MSKQDEGPRCYRVVRMYYEPSRRYRVIKRGLTLAEAQTHCSDPETSSRTCKRPPNVARTRRLGPWFDGYEVAR